MNTALSPPRRNLGPRPLTIEEVAEVYHRPVSFVRSWIDSGRLPAMRLGQRTIRVRWDDVVAQYCGVPQCDLEHPDITAANRVERGLPPAPKPAPPQFIYFVEAEGCGRLKIGFSKTPERRIADLRTMGGAPINVLAVVYGCQKTERRLHECFKAERQHGEWFAISERLQRFVKSCQALGRLPERWPRAT